MFDIFKEGAAGGFEMRNMISAMELQFIIMNNQYKEITENSINQHFIDCSKLFKAKKYGQAEKMI